MFLNIKLLPSQRFSFSLCMAKVAVTGCKFACLLFKDSFKVKISNAFFFCCCLICEFVRLIDVLTDLVRGILERSDKEISFSCL